MSKLMDKLKRMVPFHAEQKQKLLKNQQKEPEFEFSTQENIEEKFNEYCTRQAQMLVNFDLKVPPPQLDEEQLKAYQKNKTSRNSIRKKSTIIKPSKLGSIRSSLILQTDQIQTGSPRYSQAGSTYIPEKSIRSKKSSEVFLKQFDSQIQYNPKDVKSQSQANLKTSATLSSTFKLSPIKINHEKQNSNTSQGQAPINSPQKRLTKHFEMRSSQGNIRFSKKKSTVIFNSNINGESKKQEDKDSDIDERISQSPEWILIQQKLKNAIKNKKQDKGDDYVNPVVQLFGNNFIAMVLQALVIKKIDDVFGMKINTDSNIPISENLLKQFGISSAMLNSLNSATEKKQYIADTMTARISLMIKEWDEKQNTREVKLKQDIKLQQKEEKRKQANLVDMFDWLKIGTNHDHLKKKLRMTIIEKLTDFENQEEITKLRILKQPNSQNNLPENQKLELHLKNLPYVSTKVLLLRMDEKDNKYLKEGLTKEQLDQYEEVQHVDYINENKKNSTKSGENISDQSQLSKKSFQKDADELPEWSEELEKEFLNNKRMARLIYSQDIDVSSWSQQGYLPLVQEYNLSNKKKMEREQLITNYQNGIWLTEKELKFIADTSQLLNKCIDKNYVQRIVNHISKDDVYRLELSLAENIITNYENMQRLIREQRLKFLKERQAQLLEQREEARKKQIIKENREKELKIQRRYVKMFKTIGDRLLSSKAAYTFDILQKNFFCRLFFEKMRDVLRRLRKRKELLAYKTEESAKKEKLSNQLANQKDFVKRLAKASNQKKLCGKQHELHPPSKVSYYAPSDGIIIENIDPLDPKRIELMDFMIDRFQLSTRSKQEVRVQENFSKFYSGGPNKSDLDEQNGVQSHVQKVQLTKQQFAGIVRVQRLFRQFRMRRIIKDMKEQEFSIKQSIYREKIKSYMSGRNFLKVAQKKSGKELIPDKKPIEIININQSDELSESLYSSDDEQGQYKDKSKKNNQKQKNSQMSQQINILTVPIEQTPKKDKQGVKDLRNFYHVQGNYGESLSTDRNHIGSKTVDDESISKQQNSTIKFLTNERNDTQSDLNETDNLSNESPKTKASEQLDQYKKSNNRLKTDSMDDKPRISFTRCENTEGGSTFKNTNMNGSVGSFLTPKSLRFTPTLLLKQQKLLQAAKTNNFLQIKNSGFLINENDSNCKDNESNTPLIYTIAHQNLVFMRWLLCKGANVNTVCANGNTPVHQAFKTNNPEIIHDILCMKPNFNIVNIEGLTPLGYATLDIINKFDLKDAIVYKTDSINTFDEADTTVQNNNQLFQKDKKPLKGIGKVRINNFYPIKTPTIKVQNYTSM